MLLSCLSILRKTTIFRTFAHEIACFFKLFRPHFTEIKLPVTCPCMSVRTVLGQSKPGCRPLTLRPGQNRTAFIIRVGTLK